MFIKKIVIIELWELTILITIFKKYAKKQYQLSIKNDFTEMKLTVYLRKEIFFPQFDNDVLIRVKTIFHNIFPVYTHWYDLEDDNIWKPFFIESILFYFEVLFFMSSLCISLIILFS